MIDKKKEYLGDAIITMALSIAHMGNDNLTFATALSRIYKVRSNSNLADVARELNIKPDKEVKKEGFKKYADAVEIFVGDLYLRHGLAVAMEWVKINIIDKKVTIPKKLKNKKDGTNSKSANTGQPS